MKAALLFPFRLAPVETRLIRGIPAAVLLGLVLALSGPPARAEDMVLTDFSASSDALRFSAPKVEISGTSLTKAEVEGLLKTGTVETALARLSSLGAARIAFGELTIEQGNAGDPNPLAKRSYVFKDLVFTRVTNGIAASVTTGALRFTHGHEEVTAASMRLAALDAAFLLKLLMNRATPETNPRVVLGDGTVEKLAYAKPEQSLAIASITLKDLRSQPGEASPHLLGLSGRVVASDWKVIAGATASRPQGEWALKSLALQADSIKDGVPSQFAVRAEGLVFDKSAVAARGFGDLGYDTLTASLAVEGGYDAKKQELTVKTASLTMPNLGAMTLTALLGKVTPDNLIAGKPLGTTAATVKTMSLTVVNDGFYERIVQREARKSGKSLEETRERLSAQGRATVALLMGAYPGNPVTEALTRFAGAPGTLDIRSTSKEAGDFRSPISARRTTRGP